MGGDYDDDMMVMMWYGDYNNYGLLSSSLVAESQCWPWVRFPATTYIFSYLFFSLCFFPDPFR